MKSIPCCFSNRSSCRIWQQISYNQEPAISWVVSETTWSTCVFDCQF